jgi:hypothetical protein
MGLTVFLSVLLSMIDITLFHTRFIFKVQNNFHLSLFVVRNLRKLLFFVLLESSKRDEPDNLDSKTSGL